MLAQVDRVAELRSHLTFLDRALNLAEPSAVAGLVRERRLTLLEIAATPAGDGSLRNEIAEQRSRRRAAAAGSETSARRGNKRSG